jgi:hypothetical protein
MTILELSGFFVAIQRVCSRLFTAYRGNIVARHRLFDSPRRPEAADRIRPAARPFSRARCNAQSR